MYIQIDYSQGVLLFALIFLQAIWISKTGIWAERPGQTPLRPGFGSLRSESISLTPGSVQDRSGRGQYLGDRNQYLVVNIWISKARIMNLRLLLKIKKRRSVFHCKWETKNIQYLKSMSILKSFKNKSRPSRNLQPKSF